MGDGVAAAPVSSRSAGLVEATEGLYRGLLAIALGFTLGAAAWGTLIAPFNGFSDHHLRSVGIGVLLTAAAALAFLGRDQVYASLRRQPAWLLSVAVLAIAVLWLDGGWRSSFYLVSYAAIVMAPVVAGLRWSMGCALLIATGYATGLAINGYSWDELKSLNDADSVIANTGGYLLAAFFFAAPVRWLGGYVARINQVIQQRADGGGATTSGGPARTGALSVREVEVVQLIAGGATNDQIAARLVISTRTVHSHVQNAMKKTGARNRTDLAVLAVQDGLVPDRKTGSPDSAVDLSEAY